MALLAGNLTALLSVKIKPRHDDYTDQVSRIIVVKMLIVAALVTGIDWFHDTVACLPPKHPNNVPNGFLESVCWIKGFYVYPDLPLDESGYYGIPLALSINGRSESSENFCSTVGKYHTPNDNCVPLKKRFMTQYQWIPFCLAFMSLLFYVPYMIFRVVNTDMISLKANLDDKVRLRTILWCFFSTKAFPPNFAISVE